ncbi:MAG: N-acetylneuraminate synthase family protein [Vicinamibacterales bacterium]
MARYLEINGQPISDETDCYVIAEIGHNHQGSVEKAKELFKAAKDCGVSAVKLQKRSNKTLFTKALYDQAYDNENSFGPTYGAHREALEFGWDEYVDLKAYTDAIGVTFFATAFDFESADFHARLDVPAYKMASGDQLNIPQMTHVARIGKPMIVSTGGGTMDDVQRVYDAVMPINPQLCILQCTAAYPAEPEQMNLRVITTFRERYPDTVIGLSDHQNGIAMADVAYLLGARVVEKHFTLNRAWKGSDHAYSLEPVGMRKLVRDLHRVREALGDGIKQTMACEAKPLYKMGKKLVAATGLPAGHVLTREDIAIKSPNDGLPPYEIDRVIGRTLARALEADDSIRFEDLAG